VARVCVTGSSGYLGSRICSGLSRLGHSIICVDMVPPEKVYGNYRKADFRDESNTINVIKDVDIVIHCGSIHPWKKYTDEEYLDMNVKGTWNVFKAASENGIGRIILTSSIAASGYSPAPELLPVDESYQSPSLSDMYSLTKFFQEQTARHFCNYRGMRTIALRPPNFTPKPPVHNEAALLSGCAVVEDIASAHLKAVDAWESLENSFEPFFITPSFPYLPDEVSQLSKDPKSVIEKYYPQAWSWFERQGIRLNPVPMYYDNSKVKRMLGWEAEYTFAQWWNTKGKEQLQCLSK